MKGLNLGSGILEKLEKLKGQKKEIEKVVLIVQK
jgi:hypothetical protein